MDNADLVEVSVRELNRLRAVEKVARDLVERSACYPDGRLRFWSPVKRLERLLANAKTHPRDPLREHAYRIQIRIDATAASRSDAESLARDCASQVCGEVSAVFDESDGDLR